MLRNAIDSATHHSKIGESVMRFGIIGGFCLLLALVTSSQEHPPNTRLSEAEFRSLAGRCAPGAPADTLLAIANTESALYPNAISVNRPNAAARRVGYSDGQLVLTRQPKNRKEAIYWLHWLASHGYTVSI